MLAGSIMASVSSEITSFTMGKPMFTWLSGFFNKSKSKKNRKQFWEDFGAQKLLEMIDSGSLFEGISEVEIGSEKKRFIVLLEVAAPKG